MSTRRLQLSLAFTWAFAAALPAQASFERSKSINATAETLAQGEGEVGFASLSVGVTDDIMLTVPTLPLLWGSLTAGGKFRINVSDTIILSPAASFGHNLPEDVPTASIGGSATLRLDGGKQALSFGATGTKGSFDFEDEELLYRDEWTLGYFGNYDWYGANGDLVFVGILGSTEAAIPYFGYTWAWEHFHLGVGLAAILPYAYFYWRF